MVHTIEEIYQIFAWLDIPTAVLSDGNGYKNAKIVGE
jgi:hypothetical protein